MLVSCQISVLTLCGRTCKGLQNSLLSQKNELCYYAVMNSGQLVCASWAQSRENVILLLEGFHFVLSARTGELAALYF